MRIVACVCALLLSYGLLPLRAGQVMPDFKLRDANPNSARHDALVSPRDYLLQVSAFYFGHAD